MEKNGIQVFIGIFLYIFGVPSEKKKKRGHWNLQLGGGGLIQVATWIDVLHKCGRLTSMWRKFTTMEKWRMT